MYTALHWTVPTHLSWNGLLNNPDCSVGTAVSAPAFAAVVPDVLSNGFFSKFLVTPRSWGKCGIFLIARLLKALKWPLFMITSLRNYFCQLATSLCLCISVSNSMCFCVRKVAIQNQKHYKESCISIAAFINQTCNLKKWDQFCLTSPILHKTMLTDINYIPALYFFINGILYKLFH